MVTQTYQYIDTNDQMQNIDAESPEQAIATAPNRASDSGVQLVTAPTVVTSNQANDQVNNVQGVIDNYTNTEIPKAKTPADKIGDLEEMGDVSYQTYKTKIDSINRRDLSPEEQAELDNVQATFDRTREMQIKANKEFEMGTTIAGIRAGRNRYATEIEQGNIKSAIDQGISKLADLDGKAKSKMFELKQAMLDKNYERAVSEYEMYNDLIKEKKKSIFDLAELARKDQELILDQYNATRTAEIKEYEYAVDQGYDGTMLDYMKAAKAAKRVAGSGGDILTEEERAQLNLPASLVGTSERDLIMSLSYENPPQWYLDMFPRTTNESTQDMKVFWDQFRNQPDMEVFKKTVDINKVETGKQESQSGDGDNPFS